MNKVKWLRYFFFVFFALAVKSARGADLIGYDIFIVAGQSNAVGAGQGEEVDPLARPEIDDKIDQLGRFSSDNFKIIPMGHQLQHWGCDQGVCAVGFASSFARNYVQRSLGPGRRVLLVPAALGGSGSFQWDEVIEKVSWPNFQDSRVLLDDLTLRIRHLRALPGKNIFAGLLWHQGETDALCLTPGVWCASLTQGVKGFSLRIQNLFRFLRQEAQTDFPILVGGFVPRWGQGSFRIWSSKQQIEGALQRLAQEIPRVGYVESRGLTSNAEVVRGSQDRIHFSAPAQIEFGRRYFQIFQSLSAP